jgi:hypothetical protein
MCILNNFQICLALVAIAWASGTAVNKDVQRTVDASSSTLKIYLDIKATNVEKEYQIAFPTYQAEHLSFIEVKQKGKALRVSAPIRLDALYASCSS